MWINRAKTWQSRIFVKDPLIQPLQLSAVEVSPLHKLTQRWRERMHWGCQNKLIFNKISYFWHSVKLPCTAAPRCLPGDSWLAGRAGAEQVSQQRRRDESVQWALRAGRAKFWQPVCFGNRGQFSPSLMRKPYIILCMMTRAKSTLPSALIR